MTARPSCAPRKPAPAETRPGSGLWSDRLRFARSWLADPLRVAAIAPSGASLARLITREIGPAQAPVLELGPGTGVFTRVLLDRGVAESDLTLIEYGPGFAALLRTRFPQARVVEADAARLAGLDLFHDRRAGVVVSGLGLLSMRPRAVLAILSGAFACLRPAGAFYQFTYGPRCPVPRPILDRLGLKAVRIGGTLANLPPASVYRITRRGPGSLRRPAPQTQADHPDHMRAALPPPFPTGPDHDQMDDHRHSAADRAHRRHHRHRRAGA